MEAKYIKIEKSKRKDKKYMAIFYGKDKNKLVTIHFGQKGASDFTIHRDDERKKRYIDRHEKRENWNMPMSAGSLSRWILWNKPTFDASLRDYMNKFNLSKL